MPAGSLEAPSVPIYGVLSGSPSFRAHPGRIVAAVAAPRVQMQGATTRRALKRAAEEEQRRRCALAAAIPPCGRLGGAIESPIHLLGGRGQANRLRMVLQVVLFHP